LKALDHTTTLFKMLSFVNGLTHGWINLVTNIDFNKEPGSLFINV